MVFCYVPPGVTELGCNKGEVGRYKYDLDPYLYTQKTGYWLGKFEVTQREWTAVMGDAPSNFKGDDRPVESVSANRCDEFLKRVNARAGVAAGVFGAVGLFALPRRTSGSTRPGGRPRRPTRTRTAGRSTGAWR